jgi:hypothetical protein
LLAGCGADNAAAGGAGGSGAASPAAAIVSAVADSPEAFERSVVLYFGDMQPEASIAEYGEVGSLVEGALKAHPDTGVILQCGDLVNAGDAPEEWDAFLAAVGPALVGIPFMTSPGNHEVTAYAKEAGHKPRYYLDVFELPENGPEGYKEEYYSFDYGSVHYVSLSSNYLDPAESYSDDEAENAAIAAEIDRWIEDDLAGTDKPWKVVMMHHPAFPLGGTGTAAAMRARWIPLFERAGADLLLVGHEHSFMRSWPLLGGEEDEGGIVQIMGNASEKNYEDDSDLPFVAFHMGGIAGYHAITATPDSLSVEAYGTKGKVLDYWGKTK